MPTPQQPIGSRFGAADTAADVVSGIDLSGKVAIVTGGHSGIGAETTRALRAAGATVVVPVRDPDRARAMLAGIDGVEVEQLDLIDPASVDAFAERFLASGRPLHMLVNSAGIMNVPLHRDARGYESHFATNHLGHFQLAARLWPALRRAEGARVVAVSAWAHRLSPVVFDDPQFERRDYDPWLGYGQSKTANILFALALDQRGEADGIRGFSLHPGSIVGTNLSRWSTPEQLKALGVIDDDGVPVIDPDSGRKTAAQGASTSVWCATSPQLDGLGGVYCESNEVSPLVPLQDVADLLTRGETPIGVVSHAVDPAAAERLWALSERLMGSAI
ncbi:SDR family NAD(P)-dependent oxidoreductase [Conexibacter sp. CPCC 206217]|uniref:SDR family NAD(P)-dependent oxidoreductase n=1 Tax=Conexibacter sp. CPCC 206217 TaxID=3064574 RepID=UPI002718E9B3|nr:SDR family NAD(P)-dependent oxidoreductase [Conexibacter sp. CPCC 206217]MDO8211608.1 SDR family NAD(P)-dependent oxidoreductase [Conexibacter sp. CPCC 206217]